MQARSEHAPDVVIITGMSGAGRTGAMHTFEDMGYYCIDNLPSVLIEQVVELADLSNPEKPRLAIVCDARSLDFLSTFNAALDALDKRGVHYEVLFLDASDDTLLNRYQASRRKHPLISDGRTAAGIKKERVQLEQIRNRANAVIDTSSSTSRQLANKITRMYAPKKSAGSYMRITVGSFGFKYGIPSDADIVIDVRFLPNPYYIERLKPLTGLDAPVRDYVLEKQEVQQFIKRWHALLDVLMPGYVSEKKSHLFIAIGCTGGQHRSVVIAEETAEYLKSKGYRLDIVHVNMPGKQA